MSDLSPERMMELLTEHEHCELMGDLDGVMATLVKNPVFELHPQKLRIAGYEAVREMYGNLLPGFDEQFAESREAEQQSTLRSSITAFADSLLVTEVQDEMKLPDGNTTRMRMLVVVYYQDGKILGQRLFCDNDFAGLINSALGPDFVNLPGVTTIVDEYPCNIRPA